MGRRWKACAVIALALAAAGCSSGPRLHVVQLPPGMMELRAPITVAGGTEIRGAPGGSMLHMAAGFQGQAAIIVQGDEVWLHGFSIDGNRGALESVQGLPPYNKPFVSFTPNNGIVANGVSGLAVGDVHFSQMAGFAILVARSQRIDIRRVRVDDSGSRSAGGRNNATGGILFEEGSADFHVTASDFRNILGNGLWTHSLYTSPRNELGVFARNRFQTIGRDAIQIGHANDIRVTDNIGVGIGFPLDVPDTEGGAIPVAIDTAGNVENAVYLGNRFSEINGKCMDLDGLHDSEIRGNVCVNNEPPAAYPLGNYAIVMNDTNPDMRTRNIRIVGNRIERPVFGGVFVIGEKNRIVGNLLLDLNTAHCNQNIAHYQCNYAPADPHILETGVYFGRGAERPAPARGNLVENNVITGWGMKERCVGSAPDIPADWNTVRGNRCE